MPHALFISAAVALAEHSGSPRGVAVGGGQLEEIQLRVGMISARHRGRQPTHGEPSGGRCRRWRATGRWAVFGRIFPCSQKRKARDRPAGWWIGLHYRRPGREWSQGLRGRAGLQWMRLPMKKVCQIANNGPGRAVGRRPAAQPAPQQVAQSLSRASLVRNACSRSSLAGPAGCRCLRIHQRITKRHFSLSSDDECREAILAKRCVVRIAVPCSPQKLQSSRAPTQGNRLKAGQAREVTAR